MAEQYAAHAFEIEADSTHAVGHGHQGAQHVAHRFLNWFTGVSTAISLSPFVLSALDIGKVREVRQTVDFNGACCSIIAAKSPLWKAGNYSFTNIPAGQVFQGLDGEHRGIQGNTYGLAGMLSHLFLKMPGVGYHLGTGTLPEPLNAQIRRIPRMGDYAAELKLANALAAGGIILLGELSGAALEKWEKRRAIREAEEKGEDAEAAAANAGKAGRAISTGAKGFGLFIALPTILAGVGHAIQITTATFGIDKVSDISNPEGIGGHIMAFLGKPMGECGGQFKAPTGAATAGLVGVCCAVPAALGALSLFISRCRNSAAETGKHTMKTPSPADMSPLKDDLDSVIRYHHDIPWERFEQEAQQVSERMAKLEQEVARKERLGSIAKWGMRAAALAGAATGAYLWQKRAGAAASAPIDTSAAQASLDAFDAADKAPGVPKLLTNRAPGSTEPALLGDPGTEEATAAFREQMGKLPPKAVFRRINEERIRAMGEKGGAIPGCCVNPQSGCCGTPYYRGDVAKGMYSALQGIIGAIPEAGSAATKANRQLAFAGVTATGVGMFFELANRLEHKITAKPRQELEALRTRHQVLQGVIGHMERDAPDNTRAAHSGHSR